MSKSFLWFARCSVANQGVISKNVDIGLEEQHNRTAVSIQR